MPKCGVAGWSLIVAMTLGVLGGNPRADAQEALPLEYSPTGVLFRVKAPGAKNVYLAGTFNGWGGSDGTSIADPACKMFGPDEQGGFEVFYSLTPGTHVFKYAIDGNRWIPGPPDLPRAKDDFDTTSGQGGMMGSMFEFALQEPPWPSYVPTKEMLPVVVTHKQTGEPYVRIRFFSRQATEAHVVGSWDGWGGISNRAVASEKHAMKKTRVPNIWENHIGPLKEGVVEYKIVVNKRQWLSDPSVIEQSQDGNTRINVTKGGDGKWFAEYNPRFDPAATRKKTSARWGGTLEWEDDRNEGFRKGSAQKKRMLWVITMPKSALSEKLMKEINADPQLTAQLKDFVCLETAANEVDDIVKRRKIYRLPYVILVDSNYKPVYEKFNPSLAELKEKVATLK